MNRSHNPNFARRVTVSAIAGLLGIFALSGCDSQPNTTLDSTARECVMVDIAKTIPSAAFDDTLKNVPGKQTGAVSHELGKLFSGRSTNVVICGELEQNQVEAQGFVEGQNQELEKTTMIYTIDNETGKLLPTS